MKKKIFLLLTALLATGQTFCPPTITSPVTLKKSTGTANNEGLTFFFLRCEKQGLTATKISYPDRYFIGRVCSHSQRVLYDRRKNSAKEKAHLLFNALEAKYQEQQQAVLENS